MLLFGSIIRGKNVAVVVSRRIAKRLGEARERERDERVGGDEFQDKFQRTITTF